MRPVRTRDRQPLGLGCALPAFAALLVSCASSAAPPEPAMGRVVALIGDAACTTDDQCATIAVGAKACGGPQAYLPWSRARTGEAALRAAAVVTTRRPAADSREEQSTCAMVLDPGAVCAPADPPSGQRGICRLRPAGTSGIR